MKTLLLLLLIPPVKTMKAIIVLGIPLVTTIFVPSGYYKRPGECAHEILQWDDKVQGTIETTVGKTLQGCADFCDRVADCYSFEYYHDYGSSGVHYGFPVAPPQMCQITRQYDMQCQAIVTLHLTCPGKEFNVDLYVKREKSPLDRYTKKLKSCAGENRTIRTTKAYSPDDCAQKCDSDPKCKSFEYFANYHGGGFLGIVASIGHCQLTTLTLEGWCAAEHCPGENWNTDLFLVKENPNAVHTCEQVPFMSANLFA
eukprot:GEMP01007442.1.p1 GENE.GEMP01007442.1~~GEMP01007442.1.p1  ORF type:complete len:256 (-),score=41.92 GEMP01007442.1:2859-3626(-)